MENGFWLLLIGATILWYIIVTILVAIRGGKNIRDMIRELME